MKQVHSNALFSSAAACVLLAAQPAFAQVTQITEVKLNPNNGGVNVMLSISAGNKPQVFTTKRDNALVADIINTQLRLPKGESFRQENPAPGIALVEVNQLDANSVRVKVTGVDEAPTNQPIIRKDNNLTLGFMASGNATASNSQPANNTASLPATTVTTPGQPAGKIDVLVPNPEISIDGQPAQPAGPNKPYNVAPPFLPRAVAPPVGDITVSNTDTAPKEIDLGTQERLPRLVLREASVREVLSLLARAAGLNLAYVGSEGAAATPQPTPGAAATAASQTISLDIENEPVQDVFNYVLRLSGLQANRSGRTIFVGANLPNTTRDTVMRSLRLNQVSVRAALDFLVTLGAESAVSRERLVTSVSAVPVTGAENAVTNSQTTTETKIEVQRVDYKDSQPLLRGLQASGDERTNSVTLVGDPKIVEMAVSQLTQLDVRRRQVVVNLKIIDVNLTGIQDYKASFSFGLGDSFFVSDGGAAAFNYGRVNPPSQADAVNSVLSPTVIGTQGRSASGPYVIPQGVQGQSFLDYQTNAPFGRNNDIDPTRSPDFLRGSPNNQWNARPGFGTTNNPLLPGITQSNQGQVTYQVPTLFQYPTRFLSSLQTQVTNGNAKILTDPTLIVQEGQNAEVKLISEVYGGIRVTPELREPIIKEAGLTLAVRVERIDDNGFVSLSVAPTVAGIGGTAATVDGTISLLAARTLESGLIRLRDGQTLILSGIIQESDRTTVTKLPILGDIPLLGSLFRSTNKDTERREVIVLLTPQVMDDSQRSAYGYNYNPSPQVRQVLERQNVNMPGSRR
ncbi:MAG: type IV pilus secretin family protein [Nostocales cyanobacterium]|nr:MAG: type IV pilus secretin family protein [Nostocales cyanobacterium]TAF12407.1 MAG: type IV pilus secretin family protein [Nostocales cyanobacterium]